MLFCSVAIRAQIGMTKDEIGGDTIILEDRPLKFSFVDGICNSFLISTTNTKTAENIQESLNDKYYQLDDYTWKVSSNIEVYFIVTKNEYIFLVKKIK